MEILCVATVARTIRCCMLESPSDDAAGELRRCLLRTRSSSFPSCLLFSDFVAVLPSQADTPPVAAGTVGPSFHTSSPATSFQRACLGALDLCGSGKNFRACIAVEERFGHGNSTKKRRHFLKRADHVSLLAQAVFLTHRSVSGCRTRTTTLPPRARSPPINHQPAI